MIRNKSDTMVDAATLEKLEAGFAKLAASDSKSLLKKYLTKEVFDALKTKKTPSFGSSLLDCVQSGEILTKNSHNGIDVCVHFDFLSSASFAIRTISLRTKCSIN